MQVAIGALAAAGLAAIVAWAKRFVTKDDIGPLQDHNNDIKPIADEIVERRVKEEQEVIRRAMTEERPSIKIADMMNGLFDNANDSDDTK